MVVGVDEVGTTQASVGNSRARRLLRCGSFEQLVELAAVEPDAAALGAVVDLDALPVGHDQRLVGAVRALQGESFLVSAFKTDQTLAQPPGVGVAAPQANQ